MLRDYHEDGLKYEGPCKLCGGHKSKLHHFYCNRCADFIGWYRVLPEEVRVEKMKVLEDFIKKEEEDEQRGKDTEHKRKDAQKVKDQKKIEEKLRGDGNG